jgi:hypothetical protein
MEVKGFLIFLTLVYVMITTDKSIRESLGFPPPPSKDAPKKEKVVPTKKKVDKFSIASNSFVVCDNFDVTDCGVTLFHCINGEEKYECVKESEFKIIQVDE